MNRINFISFHSYCQILRPLFDDAAGRRELSDSAMAISRINSRCVRDENEPTIADKDCNG